MGALVSRHDGLGRSTRGDLAVGFVTVLGLSSTAAFLYGLVSDLHFAAFPSEANVFVVAFLALPAAGLLVAGYCLRSSGLEDDAVWRVGTCAVLGTVLAAVVAILLLSRIPLGETSIGGLFVLLVGSAGEGALLGVVVGLARATRKEPTAIDPSRDRLLLLHRLLQHNLRNRLNVIDGYVELLASGDDPAERAVTIDAQLDAAIDLLDDARLLVDAGKGGAERASVDLSAMLDRRVRLIEETYPSATIEVDYPDDVRIRADEVVEAAVENVLDNAVRHNDRAEPSIRVSLDDVGGRVVLTVADDGPGIPDGEKESVFDPTRGADHGLGLYLTRELAERYDGEVRIEDGDPRGTAVVTTFRRSSRG